MMKRSRLIKIMFLLLSFVVPLYAEADPRVKVLLQEALRLYGERQYVRALDLFKQAQSIDPENKTANSYIENTEKRIREWENLESDPNATHKEETTWESLLEQKKNAQRGGISNAKEIIAIRRSLVERMRNRSSNTDNIVQIEDNKKGGLKITLFHDQLFVPGLQTLRDEALPILDNVADLLRTRQDRSVTIRSLAHSDSNDPFLLYPSMPNMPGMELSSSKSKSTPFLFEDIEATRSMILFTHLAQKSMSQVAEQK